jgi:hypothetical protein
MPNTDHLLFELKKKSRLSVSFAIFSLLNSIRMKNSEASELNINSFPQLI